MPRRPGSQALENRRQGEGFLRRGVVHARRDFVVRRAGQESGLDEFPESFGEGVGGELQAVLDVHEPVGRGILVEDVEDVQHMGFA